MEIRIYHMPTLHMLALLLSLFIAMSYGQTNHPTSAPTPCLCTQWFGNASYPPGIGDDCKKPFLDAGECSGCNANAPLCTCRTDILNWCTFVNPTAAPTPDNSNIRRLHWMYFILCLCWCFMLCCY